MTKTNKEDDSTPLNQKDDDKQNDASNKSALTLAIIQNLYSGRKPSSIQRLGMLNNQKYELEQLEKEDEEFERREKERREEYEKQRKEMEKNMKPLTITKRVGVLRKMS